MKLIKIYINSLVKLYMMEMFSCVQYVMFLLIKN